MTTDPKPRLFDYDREPLGLLPESMKTTIEVNDQRAIATLHAPRWRRKDQAALLRISTTSPDDAGLEQ